MDEPLYNVFVRNWWKLNPAWPGGREPDPCARKHRIARGVTYTEARRLCEQYNTTHSPGRLSRKAEFEQCNR